MAKRKIIRWSELSGERLIAVARSSGNRQLQDDALTQAGIRPQYAFEVSHVVTLLGMVEAGLGVAALPRMTLPHKHPSLVGVALREPKIVRTLGFLTKHGVTLRPAAQSFFQHLHTVFKRKKGLF